MTIVLLALKIYKVSTKIITSNDNIVGTVRVFKDGFTDTFSSRHCEMQAVIRLLCAERKSMAGIQCRLCMVYKGNVIPARTVCECVHHFHNEKRMNN